MTWPAQEDRAKSNSSVPEASLGSLPALPTSLKRNQSFGCSAQSARLRTSGSLAASQCRSGPAIPGTSGLANTARIRSGRAR